jgi:hypothetical protein
MHNASIAIGVQARGRKGSAMETLNGIVKSRRKFVSLAVAAALAVALVITIRLGYGLFLLHVLAVILKGFAIASLFEALVP